MSNVGDNSLLSTDLLCTGRQGLLNEANVVNMTSAVLFCTQPTNVVSKGEGWQ